MFGKVRTSPMIQENVYWKEECSTQFYIDMKPRDATKRSQTNFWHLKCSVTEGSYISFVQSEKKL